MARLSSANPPDAIPDPAFINLTRLLARLNSTLNSHEPDTESKLRRSSLERERVGKNLEYARGLLLKLEQDALDIRIQSRKQETQIELVKKRESLQRLAERLEELNDLAEPESEDDSSEGEDLLGEDTPSEETDDQISQAEPTSPTVPEEAPLHSDHELSFPQITVPQPPAQSEEPASTLRSRQNPRAELFPSQNATASGSTTGLSTATAEALLTHNRTEQESLTDSLLKMASALKESSQAFASSLESEKSTLNRTAEGLDKNEQGLEAASRRMGYLRSISEGRGWWGRLLMYAWIAGLMVLAILLVFVGPKFRF